MKKGIVLVLISLFVLTITGCGTSQPSQPTVKKLDTINISYVKLPLNVPSIVEKKLELFEKEFSKDNITVSFPEITEGPKMTAALASGSLNFCNALGGTSAILAAANGLDIKIIGMYSRAPKAFVIMAKNPDIITVADLKGKTVAGPKGTILHQLLLASLKQQNLPGDAVKFVNMGIPQGVTAMMSGDADAALVAGPAVPKAVEASGRIIATGEGFLDATIVIAVEGKFLQENLGVVKRYMKVHQQSLTFMKENPDEVYRMATDETGISVEDVKKMYSWYDFNPAITDNDIKDLEKTQEFLLQNGLLTQKVAIQKLIKDMSKEI
ncbi:NrtA/SsuA/CpmA family ABC transporter substrate-binding protein [Sporomusa sp.]|uniref:ABC transporter substrate-binding protein n=1 Tax=Sporomusa sp. TaxID=2078658 RepID=UPI002D085EA9|nr:NrtA/SsuA/CpmA family ABC transporter substrate-binding protein [Sporomusa sp.]HWR42402.1 NrtA/SsuA/CpmA family ABC transporter substrate-binding protein [Sporomusa sp.]